MLARVIRLGVAQGCGSASRVMRRAWRACRRAVPAREVPVQERREVAVGRGGTAAQVLEERPRKLSRRVGAVHCGEQALAERHGRAGGTAESLDCLAERPGVAIESGHELPYGGQRPRERANFAARRGNHDADSPGRGDQGRQRSLVEDDIG